MSDQNWLVFLTVLETSLLFRTRGLDGGVAIVCVCPKCVYLYEWGLFASDIHTFTYLNMIVGMFVLNLILLCAKLYVCVSVIMSGTDIKLNKVF